jgi:hypothetical protein
MQGIDSSDPTCQRFNSIRLHDSELRGIEMRYAGLESRPENRYEIALKVNRCVPRLPHEEERFQPTELRFLQVRYFSTDIDLLGLTYCGGDISDAKCSEDSGFLRKFFSDIVPNFNLPQDEKSLEGLKHFGIYLCNPSGEINIIAKDYVLLTM